MKKIIIFLGLFLLLPGTGLGATSEPIEGGRLLYEDGAFDPFSFNANIRNGRILLDDGSTGRFDHLVARSHVDADTGQQVIDRLQVENLKIQSNGQEISIARILIIGGRTEQKVNWGRLSGLLDVGFLAWSKAFDIDDVRVRRQGVDLMMIEKMKLRIDSPDLSVDFPEYDLQAVFRGIKIPAGIRGEILPPLIPGKDHYVANIIVEGDAAIDGDLYGGRSRMALEIEGIGTLDLDVATSHNMDELQRMLEVLENTDEDEMNWGLFWPELAAASFLHHFTLEVVDEGGLRVLYDIYTSTEVSEEDIRIKLLAAFQGKTLPHMPFHSTKFAEQADNWLREGGSLKFSIEPDSPVRLDSIATPDALGNLDQILRRLNTTLEHR